MDLRTLYRDIVETSPDGIWVFDTDGATIYANRRIAELLAMDPAELDSLHAFDPLDDVGRQQMAQHLGELRHGQTNTGEVECLWHRRDGDRLWVTVQESTLRDEDGSVIGFLHRVSDYSDRRRLFEELSHSRHLLAEAQRIAKVGSYEWDVVQDVVVASDELHSLYGVPREEFAGTFDGFVALVDEADRDVVRDAVRTALDGADTLDFEVRVHTAYGTTLWVRGRGEIFRDLSGAPVRVRGTHQDVTEAKLAEHALQDLVAQNTLMQAVATAANEAETLAEVLTVAQDLLLVHDDWVRGRAYLPEEGTDAGLVPLHLDERGKAEDLANPEVTELERRLAEEVLRTRVQVWDEHTREGRPSIAFPVMLGGDVAAVIVITACTPFERHAMIRSMIDQVAVQLGRVAERERAARDLATARDAAMAASRQKSEFLATMSHEIRTPLNGVIGLNDLLLRTELDAHQQRLASGAQVASRALLGIVNDILDFSKIEAGRLEMESVDFDVREVFDQVASVLGEAARSKGLELLVSCHPDVPDRLNGDPTRLAQVLTNLGSNAVKFTERGEVSIRATAVPDPGGAATLRVEVVDTGIGVDPAKQQHIFDPFSQADASTTRQYGGTGLGLAISSEIVAALGGEIGLESVPERGATFWFTARLCPARAPEPAGVPADVPAVLSGRRVLVVDDNASNRLILSEHLARWNARSGVAGSVSDALAQLALAADERDPYDVVLLDMVMPGEDGLDLARAVRREPRHAKTALVLLTSAAEVDDDELAALGIAACLPKPALAGEVREALERALGASGHGDRAAPVRPAAGTVPESGRRPSRLPPSDRPRLLVVEDNPVNQLVALGILETLGYAADTADDGLEAVRKWSDGTYAAVLMDVQMPRLDGYAATRALRELESEGRRTPVLAMTAAAVEGERERCLEAGMDDFLTKPVDPDALGAMLRRWLESPGRASGREPAGSGVLDRDRLDMLRDLDAGNTAYLDRAIGNFLARVPETMHTLRTAVAADDHEGLTQAAHRVKGTALNLGLPVVGHLAHELELIGDSASTAGAAALLASLEGALDQAVTHVRWYQHCYQERAARG